MLESVIKAKHIKDYKVWIAFDDGKEGEIDLEKKIKNRGGVFQPLQNIGYFKKFKIRGGTLSWKNDSDLAPESLYELLKEQNKS
jgi:hypothetical protein